MTPKSSSTPPSSAEEDEDLNLSLANFDPTSWMKWIEDGVNGSSADGWWPPAMVPCSSGSEVSPGDNIIDSPLPPQQKIVVDYKERHTMLIHALLDGGNKPHHHHVDVGFSDNGSISSRKSARIKRKGRRRKGRDNVHPYSSDHTSSLSSLSDSSMTEPISPVSFLAPSCRLQKDKGQGLEPGTAVVVEGRDAAMEKLMNKTEMLKKAACSDDEHSISSRSTHNPFASKWKKGGAVIKRGTVKLTSINPPETRSILEVKMGFLSMKYGILLQWGLDGLVDLVVMRKMVSDSFMAGEDCKVPSPYKKPQHVRPQVDKVKSKAPDKPQRSEPKHRRTARSSPSRKEDLSSPERKPRSRPKPKKAYILRKVVGGSAIIESQDQDNAESMEVALINPPFFHPRPKKFPPSSLTVTVLSVQGFHTDSCKHLKHLYVQLSVSKESLRTGMITNENFGQNSLTLPLDKSDESLKIEVYQRRHMKKDRVLSVVHLPLELIEPHRDSSWEKCGCKKVPGKTHPFPTEITVQCRMANKPDYQSGSITLELLHLSLHHWWLRQELRARKKVDEVVDTCPMVDIDSDHSPGFLYGLCCSDSRCC